MSNHALFFRFLTLNRMKKFALVSAVVRSRRPGFPLKFDSHENSGCSLVLVQDPTNIAKKICASLGVELLTERDEQGTDETTREGVRGPSQGGDHSMTFQFAPELFLEALVDSIERLNAK